MPSELKLIPAHVFVLPGHCFIHLYSGPNNNNNNNNIADNVYGAVIMT